MWGCLFLYLAPFWNDSKEDKVWEANGPSTAIGSPRADGNRLWWTRCSRHLCASIWRRSNHIRVFWVWELMKKTDVFCYYEFCHIYKHWESSSCNKNFDCFESEARNHEEELFYVLELKVVFWLAMLLELWLASDVEFPASSGHP